MPRPTASQFAYGLVTVVVSALAMLLLSQTSSGAGVTVIALAALGLGLLVAMTVPMPRGGHGSPEAEPGSQAPKSAVGTGVPHEPTPSTADPDVTHGTARRGHGRRRIRVP